jgi:hypothetical protein
MRTVRLLLVLGLCAWLVGCGGGGSDGGGSSPPGATQQNQSIAFTQPGPISHALADGGFQNAAAGGAGTGAITYQSSDPTVATVDSSGTVTLVWSGTAQVTATKAEDASYLSATASYTLNVTAPGGVPPSGGVPFVAAIGSKDSQVTFPSWANGLDFLRSTQSDCNTAQIATCSNSEVTTVGATAITDSTATLSASSSYWIRHGASVGTSGRISLQKFPARSGPAMTSFNGKLWVVGGQQTDIALTSDVWSSDDGVSWTRVTADAGFPVRGRGQLVSFNNRLWLIGGNGGGSLVTDVWRNDVWSTADGANWRQETAAAAFSGRFDHAVVAFNGKMWVIAGAVYSGEPGGNDVWSSVDGINWTQVTNAAPFGYRAGITVTVFNNALWLTGGSSGLGDYKNDVWTSADGVNWTQVTANAGFPGRYLHSAGSINGRLVITGGETATASYVNDVWSSADGAHWTQSTGVSPFVGRTYAGSAVYNGRLFIAGGEYAAAQVSTPPNGPGLILFNTDDIWSTADATSWTQMTPFAPVFAGSYNVQQLNGKLWILGGNDGSKSRNEVWSTPDGAHWSQSATTGIFPSRFSPGTVSFNNRLWVVGGSSDDGTKDLTDVWSSADGSAWTNATSTAAFGSRHGQSVVALGNQMFVIGGIRAGTYLNDVWASSDGASWSQLTVSSPFPARASAVAASYNGRLWVLGGVDASGQRTDAWSSVDGVTWQLVSNSLPAFPNNGVALAVHDGKLWLTGGNHLGIDASTATYAIIQSNTVWSSTDGISWTQVDAAAPYSARSDAALVDFNGQMFLIGGHDFYGPRNDAWLSADGANWRVEYSGTVPLP